MVRHSFKFLKQKSELKNSTYGIFYVENSDVIKIARQSSFKPVRTVPYRVKDRKNECMKNDNVKYSVTPVEDVDLYETGILGTKIPE